MTERMTWHAFGIVAALAAAALPLTFPTGAAAQAQQEERRLRPDERQRPAPPDRPAGRDFGPERDPSIDDPRAIEQQDLATRCRPAGAPTSSQTGAGLPDQAKLTERDEQGNCLPLPTTGQPLGPKAADKLIQPPQPQQPQ